MKNESLVSKRLVLVVKELFVVVVMILRRV